MKQLLVFSDMEGTINQATTEDFMNLFSLIRSYCEKKGYDNFAFNIVTGSSEEYRLLYSDIFLGVKHKMNEIFKFDIYTGLTPFDKRTMMDSIIGGNALSKDDNNEDVEEDVIITKEVLFFDDCPVKNLTNPRGKKYFESRYDIEFNCVIVKNNIGSVVDFFEKQLICDNYKKRGSKVVN